MTDRTGKQCRITVPPELSEDPAVAAGLSDFVDSLEQIGLAAVPPGAENRGPAMDLMIRDLGAVPPKGYTPQEAELQSDGAYRVERDEKLKRLRLSSRTPLGLAYGLFALAERTRIEGRFPAVELDRVPELPYRIFCVSYPVATPPEGPDVSPQAIEEGKARFRDSVRRALRLGYNIVVLHNSQDHMSWGVASHDARSARYRRHLKELAEVAHAHHLRIMLIGDEFTYLPEYLQSFGAEASVKDQGLWDALEAKYRDLLTSCPELDGVGTRIGEHIPYLGFLTLDLIHSRESGSDPRIEERYRRFITTMQRVVAGEFGKLYLHRTWTVNVHEQHSVPQVYAETFTDDVPQDNLLLAIKLTSGDQWYHCEPYNTTFGVTAHSTIAQGELYSGYQGRGTLIDYPARYFQAALEWACDRGTKGIMSGGSGSRLTDDAILYVFSHLGWDPRASVESLTEDWAAVTFGREIREEIAGIFLQGSSAIRDGLYLRQPGLHNWDPIRHLRCDTFVMKGNPEWDNGRGHDEFLKGIYLECKPWIEETFAELDRGLGTCRRMLSAYHSCKAGIADPEKREALGDLLRHGLAAVRLNAAYVKCFLTYFLYRETPTDAVGEGLRAAIDEAEAAVRDYTSSHTLFKIKAITTAIDLAKRALADLGEAERILRESPTRSGILAMFSAARDGYLKRLEERPDAALIAHWKGTMDGRDLLRIRGETSSIEHISDDAIVSPQITFDRPLPTDRPCEVVIKPIEVRGTVYVKEQPSRENDFTLTLYLEDLTPGKTVFRFEIYAICD